MQVTWYDPQIEGAGLLAGARVSIGFATDELAYVKAVSVTDGVELSSKNGYFHPNLVSDGVPTMIDLRVLRDNPGVQTVTLEFNSGQVETFDFGGLAYTAFPFRPNLATNPQITLEMKTERVRFDDGGDQRWGYRTSPRRSVTYASLIDASDPYVRSTVSLSQRGASLYPDFMHVVEVAQDAPPGATRIQTVDDGRRRMHPGQDIVFLRNDYVAGGRVSIDAGSYIDLEGPAELAPGGAVDVPRGSIIVSAAAGVPASGTKITGHSKKIGTYQVDVRLLPGASPIDKGAPPVFKPYGMEVFPFAIEGRETLDLQIDGNLNLVDTGVGVIDFKSQYDISDHYTSASVTLIDDDRARFEQFFVRHGGKQRPFLFPAPFSADLAVGQMGPYPPNHDYAYLYLWKPLHGAWEMVRDRYIVIGYTDGSHRAMRVVEVDASQTIIFTENVGTTSGSPRLDEHLYAWWPFGLEQLGISWIGIADKAHFATDRVAMTMLSPRVFTCKVKIEQKITD